MRLRGDGILGFDKHSASIDIDKLIEFLPHGGGAGDRVCRITARAGNLYCGVTVELSGGSYVDATDGDDLNWNLRNVYQDSPGGDTGNIIEEGAYVKYSESGDGYVFERSPYKGTYPQV